MTTQITKHNHEIFGELRSLVGEDGEPWFVGKDVAEKLEYSNVSDALARHVDSEDKTTIGIHDSALNRSYDRVVINESGLYSLVLSSSK